MNCNISPLFFGYSSKQREQPCVVIVYEMDNLTEITPDEVQIFDFRGSKKGRDASPGLFLYGCSI